MPVKKGKGKRTGRPKAAPVTEIDVRNVTTELKHGFHYLRYKHKLDGKKWTSGMTMSRDQPNFRWETKQAAMAHARVFASAVAEQVNPHHRHQN